MQAVSAYTRWLQDHKTAVYGLEALVSNVTWLIPERFSASEIPAETLNSLSGLFSLVNEHLLGDLAAQPLQLLLACVQQVCSLCMLHQLLLARAGVAGAAYHL